MRKKSAREQRAVSIDSRTTKPIEEPSPPLDAVEFHVLTACVHIDEKLKEWDAKWTPTI